MENKCYYFGFNSKYSWKKTTKTLSYSSKITCWLYPTHQQTSAVIRSSHTRQLPAAYHILLINRDQIFSHSSTTCSLPYPTHQQTPDLLTLVNYLQLTLSCSSTDKALCRGRIIQRLVLEAYILAASVIAMISDIPLKKISKSPLSLFGY